MAKNEAKIRFTAETGEFNNQIKRSNTQMAELRAEMKLNDEQMKTAGKSVEGLEKKQSILEQQLAASRQKTEALSQKVQVAASIYGENSEEVSKLKAQLLIAQTAEEKLQRQVSLCADELDQQKKAASEAETETAKLSDTIEDQQKDLSKLKKEYTEAVLKYGETSDEAKDLAGKIDNLSGELKDNKDKMAEATEAADKLDKSLEDTEDNDGEGFTVFKGALADLVSEGIQFAIGKVNEFIGYLGGLPEATREIRQDFATLTTAFDNVGFSTETATETWKGLYAVFGEDDRAIETANNIAKVAKSEEDLNKWVTITTGIWGTYQDSLPVEGLAEAANETAKVGTVTGGLADALNWSSEAAVMFADYMGGDVVTAEDAFNVALSECTTEQERAKLITDTLTALYGDAAETYRETSGAMYEAKEATAEQILAENNLATSIEPVTTAWQGMKNTLLQELAPAIGGISEALAGTMQWLGEHPAVLQTVASVIGVLAAAMTAFTAVTIAHTVAKWAENAAWLASPVTWIVVGIVAAVAALIAIGVALAQNWDTITAKAAEVWQGVTEWFTKLKDGFVQIFTNIVNWIKENWQSILTFFINPFAGLFKYFYENNSKFREFVDNAITAIKELPSKVWTWLQNTITKITQWHIDMILKAKETAVNFVQNCIDFMKELPAKIQTTLSNVISKIIQWGTDLVAKGKSAATNLLNTVVNTIKTMPQKIANVGKNLVEGIWKGITNSLSWIKTKITGWVGNVTSFIKKLFGIQSPSTVMRDEVGRQLAAGVAVGIEENTKVVSEATEKLAKETVDAATKKLDAYKTYNEMTLAEEVGFWDEIRNLCAEGTEARLSADKKYLENKKKLNDEMLKAEETLQKKLDETQEKINSTAAQNLNARDLFDTFGWEYVDTNDLFKNIDSQISAMELYEESIDKLEKKIGGTALFERLEAMGVDGINEVRAFAAMTDVQLQMYNNKYEKMAELSKKLAEKQLETETIEATQEAYAEYDATIAELGVNIVDSQETMADGVVGAFDQVKQAVDTVTEGIKTAVQETKDAVKELKTYANYDSIEGLAGHMHNLVTTPYLGSSLASPNLNISNAIEKSTSNTAQKLLDSVNNVANRPIDLYINGQKFATATAGDTDIVNGSRMSLSKRGLAR